MPQPGEAPRGVIDLSLHATQFKASGAVLH